MAARSGLESTVDLYWLPLGAGGPSVRWNGRMFEDIVARRQHRPAQDLYHAALEVRLRGERFVIEMCPAWASGKADRGVVKESPVGSHLLGDRHSSVESRHSPARGGRAPGWRAGLVLAARQVARVE